MRVETLTSEEGEILDAVRKITVKGEIAPKVASSPDIAKVLEQIYFDLSYVDGTNWEEAVREIREKIYGLLR